MISLDRGLGGGDGVDVAPVAHDGDAVGDLLELLEPVGDVDDADARARGAARMIRNSSSISVSVSAAVGSSMIRTSELNESAFAISTICCCATVERRDRACAVEVRCRAVEELGSLAR